MAELEPVDAEAQALSYNFDDPRALNDKSDLRILAQVLQDVQKAETYISTTNLPVQWAENEQVFLAAVPKRSWEGTTQPRAALGMPLVLEHTTAINAQIQDILFEEDPPFAFNPRSRITMQEARAHTEILSWQLEKGGLDEEFDSGADECLRDGTAIWKASWQRINGYFCPKCEHIERQHILVPPRLRKPDIRKAEWRAHLMIVSPEALENLRGVQGYKIPPKEVLESLGISPEENAPMPNVQEAEGYFGVNSEIAKAQARQESDSVDPKKHPIELIEYCTGNRIYTVLNRKILIRNVENKGFNKVEYFSAYFIRVKGRFDGLGLAFLIGPEQRLEQGIINAMLDALALSIFGMFVRKRGSFVFPQQARVSPGRILDVDEVENFKEIKLPSPNPAAYQMLIDSESRASRRSGANEVAVQGVFPSGGSGGIGRTAEGMSLLGEAASSRLRKFVRTLEKQVFVPFLDFCVRTNPLYFDRDLLPEILDDELLEAINLDDSKKLMQAGAKIKFQILSATKMKRRKAMMETMPSIISFLQNDAVLAAIKGAQQVVEFNEVLNIMIRDVAGWPSKMSLIRPMNEQEVMQLMSENELLKELATLRAKIQLETEGKIQLSDAENAGRAGRDILQAWLEQQVKKGLDEETLGMLQGMMAAQKDLRNGQAMPSTGGMNG